MQAKRVFLAPAAIRLDRRAALDQRHHRLRWIAGLLYPDKFPEDIHAIAREFLKLLYQIDVSEAAPARILAGAQPGGGAR